MTKTKTLSEMTAAEKRIAIAKDVLLWLKAGRLVATNMTYCDLPHPMAGDLTPALKTISRKAPCEVCGIGALFIASVDRFNKFSLPGPVTSLDGDTAFAHLRRFFSASQLFLVEASFECWRGMETPMEVGIKFDSARKRLEAICRNIIKNNGVFKP